MSHHRIERNMQLSEFYNGKTIFVTGATGFLGSILLEALLRCFPGIVKIYILVRPKKGIDPEDRKKIIFKKKIWNKLLKNNPDVEDKVHVLNGDVTQPNLGMSEEDTHAVINQASIVFHCGALIKFLKSARYLALQNSKSTDYVVTLCKKLKNLDVLVYTSTAYSFCNYAPNIEEIVYRLPYPAQTFLDELENGTEESFQKLAESCQPPWINFYTFSKALSENILQDKASDLPVAIMRPAVIFSTWRTPIPGYIDNSSGMIKLIAANGRGIYRIASFPVEATVDVIPGDVVVHAHIVAAWIVATGRGSSPFAVNLSSFKKYDISVRTACKYTFTGMQGNTIPNGYITPRRLFQGSRILYWILATYEQYAPAVVFDIILRLYKSKIRLRDAYKFVDAQAEAIYKFTTTDFLYEDKNFNKLSEELVEEDREIFFMDLENLDIEGLYNNLNYSADMFDWSTDKLTFEERKKLIYRNTMIYTFVKRSILYLFCSIIFYIIYKIFF